MNALAATAAQVTSESGPMTRPRVRLMAHHRSLDDRTRRGIYHERLADCPCGAPAYRVEEPPIAFVASHPKWKAL